MKITVLDRASMGFDISFSKLEEFGDVELFDSTTVDELIGRIESAEVAILNKIKLTADVLSHAKELKLICVFATGFDNIDIAYAKAHGIAVCNVPAYSTESVTLYTMATVLSLWSKLKTYSGFVSSGEYSHGKNPNRIEPTFCELNGKTWGIVGYGNIGRRVGDVARALGARVIVNKVTPVEDAECVDIDTLCRESDIITVHCPLNDKTRKLISAERLALMKNEVVLVNEARGAVIDEAAVSKAVKERKIGAFGSDVYSQEPFPTDHPLYEIKDMDNVCLTPHCAWGAYESRVRCLDVICDNISSFINGDIKNRVEI